MSAPRFRNWCFTWNNWPPNAIESLQCLVDEGVIKFCVAGEEVGEAGTAHLQGVCQFASQLRLGSVKRVFEPYGFETSIHWEPCRNLAASIIYCRKEGRYHDLGEQPVTQGTRTDLRDALGSLLGHRDVTRFKLEYPEIYVKYPRGVSTLIDTPARLPGEKPYIMWIYGPTGTGKTRYVYDTEDHEKIWVSNGDLNWFDGYQGQEVALLDDFRASNCKFSLLLVYLDRYPRRVPVKGGYVNWAPKKIYVTSPFHPKDSYDKSEEDMLQLLRRIDEIKYTGEAHRVTATN